MNWDCSHCNKPQLLYKELTPETPVEVNCTYCGEASRLTLTADLTTDDNNNISNVVENKPVTPPPFRHQIIKNDAKLKKITHTKINFPKPPAFETKTSTTHQTLASTQKNKISISVLIAFICAVSSAAYLFYQSKKVLNYSYKSASSTK